MKGFSYSIKKLAALCDAKLIGFSTEDLIYQVFIDSKKAKYPDNHLFIALKGPVMTDTNLSLNCMKKAFAIS